MRGRYQKKQAEQDARRHQYGAAGVKIFFQFSLIFTEFRDIFNNTGKYTPTGKQGDDSHQAHHLPEMAEPVCSKLSGNQFNDYQPSSQLYQS